MELNREYSQITDLYFAVWEGNKSANYIWVKVSAKKLERGMQAVAEDLIALRNKGSEDPGAFVELISYAEDGTPILNFDDPAEDDDNGEAGDDIDEQVLSEFMLALQKMEILSWRNHFPSNRQGVSWRIDIYSVNGQKHMDGQARFPMEWGTFGRAMNELVEKTAKSM